MAAGPMLPHGQIRDFLSAAELGRLLEWTLANRAAFRPARITGNRIDPVSRRAETLRQIDPIRGLLEDRFRAVLPELFAMAGTAPFEPYLELELAAHGDGAHFAVHRDIVTGADRKPLGGDGSGKQDRVVSAVFYFHREPKGFSGGQLRLHRIGSEGRDGDFVDIEPVGNSLAAFPSWISHEVRPVRCESGAFEDNRFAINCWLCRELG